MPYLPSLDFSPATRQENLRRLKEELFDLLIIGGGITGAGVARDAALRGFRVALVEKGDFASGTSSRSSKLVHGGLRYLETMQLGLVFEACRERYILLRLAPHLVRPCPFIFPVYPHTSPGYFQLRVGMWLYDLLALFRNVQLHRALTPQEAVQKEPLIEPKGLKGAVFFYDCRVDDARLTLVTIQSAHRRGAVLVNHAEACEFLKDKGRITGTVIRDLLSGRVFPVRARLVVNATGPWGDLVRALDDPHAPHKLRPTKGAHLVVPLERAPGKHALTFISPRDGRKLFFIPWERYAIIGTTDTDYQGDLDHVYAEGEDVEYILEAFNASFPSHPLSRRDILSTYASLRPLVAEEAPSTYRISREHRIFESKSGLITISGGKLTTYRAMAEDVVNLVEKRLLEKFGLRPRLGGLRTSRLPLEGGEVPPSQVLEELSGHEAALKLGKGVLEHLVHTYGTHAANLLALVAGDEALGKPILDGLPYIWAQVVYAVRHEMALHLDDLLRRRIRLFLEGLDRSLRAAQAIAERMASLLNWDASQTERELERYEEQVRLARAV